jgi:hypothetical protein
MSHVVKVNTVIRDLDALRRAAESLGLEFREGKRTYRWFGRWIGDYPLPEGIDRSQLGKCDHAIGVPSNDMAYEIGIVSNGDGSYSLLWDFWQGGFGLQQRVGDGCRNLVERYGIEAARGAAAAQGLYCEDLASGGLRIYFPDGGTVEVLPSGRVEAFGFEGAGCADATELIASAIGAKAEESVKPEFFAERARIRALE